LSKKGVIRKQPDDRVSLDVVQEQKDPWDYAAERLTPWDKPQKDDYDFRHWTKGASEEFLDAGCLYEYVRESHKFRCRLVLQHTPKPEKFWSGILTEYERSSAGDEYLLRSGWERWLGDFAHELIANKSFAEVLRASRRKVETSLDKLATYNRYPKPVEAPGRYNVPGMQEVVIDWRHYTNKEIAAEIARKRPKSEPEPNRRGREPESKADLKALSVMRIWKREREPWKRLKLINKVCCFESCAYEWPLTNAAKAEITRARKRALSLFQHLFPWGNPANY
jgi:hypothetical protein